jgi:hypothetical protein
LRNGLAHFYETKFVIAGDLHPELIISWKAKRHCSVRRDPPGIYLNVHTMWDDLRAIHEELRKELPPGGVFPRTWLNKDTVHPTDSRAIREWAGVVRCGRRRMIEQLCARESHIAREDNDRPPR